jgi:hypothetical protein
MRLAIGLGMSALLVTTSAMAWVVAEDDGAASTRLRLRAGAATMADVAEVDEAGEPDEPGPDGPSADDESSLPQPAPAPNQHNRIGGNDAEETTSLRLPAALPALPERDPEASAPGAFERARMLMDRVEQTAREHVAKLERIARTHPRESPEFQAALREFGAAIQEVAVAYNELEPQLGPADREQLDRDGKDRLEPIRDRLVALMGDPAELPDEPVTTEPPHVVRERVRVRTR